MLINAPKLPIKILTRVTGPKVANDNAIRIKHGYDINHIHFPNFLRIIGIFQQLLNKSFQKIRCI